MQRLPARSIAFPTRRARRVAGLALGAALATLALVAATPKPPECPEVVTARGAVKLRLPESMQRALDAAAPGFRPLTMADYTKPVRDSYRVAPIQAPWAVVGDFDGDGFCDLVVDGRTRTDQYRLCAWGAAGGARVMTLGRRRLKGARAPSATALAFVAREEIAARTGAAPGTRTSDGFGLRTRGTVAPIYYWRGTRFAQVGE